MPAWSLPTGRQHPGTSRNSAERASDLVSDPLGIVDVADPRREARITSISAVVGSTSTIIIWSIAVVIAFGELGVELAPLIAGLGIAGVALGFGAQSLVKDCIAGLFMLIEDQYGIGDVVDLDEAMGTVEKISLRTTVLRGVDGTVWHVPNGEVQRVGNKSQLWSVALIDVDVAYDCDLTAARQVIIECAEALCATRRMGRGGTRPAAAAGRRGARRRRHHDSRDGQDRAGRPVGAATCTARGAEVGTGRCRHRDPVPSAHDLGAP